MNTLFSIHYHKDTFRRLSDYHFHDLNEILYVTEGTCDLLVETDMFQARRGSLILFKSGTLHKSTTETGDPYCRYSLKFSSAIAREFSTERTDLMAPFFEDYRFIQLPEEEIGIVENMMLQCSGNSAEFGADVRQNLAFIELLLYLAGNYSSPSASTALPAADRGNFQRMKPLMIYIREHASEDLSLERIAEHFYYNKHYLCRIFKEATNISVGKYITAVRIQKASTLLREGYSVQQSGLMAGFKNNSNFISSFRKSMGIPPGQYRMSFRHIPH